MARPKNNKKCPRIKKSGHVCGRPVASRGLCFSCYCTVFYKDSQKLSYLKWYSKPGNKAKKASEKREKYQNDTEYREKVRKRAREYYWANREERIAYNREYQKRNKEELLARKKEKYHNDPEYREELLNDRKVRYYKKIEDESDEPKEPKKITSKKPMPNADAIIEMQDIMFNMGKKWK